MYYPALLVELDSTAYHERLVIIRGFTSWELHSQFEGGVGCKACTGRGRWFDPRPLPHKKYSYIFNPNQHLKQEFPGIPES